MNILREGSMKKIIMVSALAMAAQIGATTANELPKYRADAVGLGTSDCRFEVCQYVTSGQWTDEVAEKSCTSRVSAQEERIAQMTRDQRRRQAPTPN